MFSATLFSFPPPSRMMSRSGNSSRDPHEAHLKRLLDQRANRSDIHIHPPSPSQYTDASSTYAESISSRLDRKDSRFKHPQNSHDRINDPSSSMLDLEDDGHSSYDSSNPDDLDDNVEDHMDDNDSADTQLRMSMLGPKMRFHSRAPWETGEDIIEEENESHNGIPSPTSNISGGRASRAGSNKMGFGRITKPRSVGGSRPSNESSRSGTKSFDTSSSHVSHSRNVLHPIRQGSGPTTPNLPSPSAPSHPVLRGKYPGGRAATPSTVSSASTNPSPSVEDTRFSVTSPPPWVIASSPSYPHEEDMHPYANPDLVVTYPENSPLSSPIRKNQAFPTVSRSDSSVTVTNSIAPSIRSVATSTLTPDNSTSSFREQHIDRSPRSRASTFQGKVISEPRAVEGAANPWNREPKLSLPNLDAAGLSNAAAPFTLISLEEARAQRSRSATANATLTPSASSINFPSRSQFPEPGNNTVERPLSVATIASVRTRSTSAGARARTALHSIIGGSSPLTEGGAIDPHNLSQQSLPSNGTAPTGKLIKHKKSGLLRMFNAKEKDKEKETPPPVPHLSDSYTQRHPIPPRHATDPTPSNISPPRNPDFASRVLKDGPGRNDADRTMLQQSAGPKRPPPSLHIITASQTQVVRPPLSSTTSESICGNREPSSLLCPEGPAPQSAPAHSLDFPALKLRPVSTMFSAHFREHIVSMDSESPEAELDAQSPVSSGHGTIPVTPGHLDTTSFGKIGVNSDDSLSAVQVLQNQFASSRKAMQLEIWDLEGRIRDLKAELEDLHGSEKGYCEACGRGKLHLDRQDSEKRGGVVNRPRVRTGTAARFGNGN